MAFLGLALLGLLAYAAALPPTRLDISADRLPREAAPRNFYGLEWNAAGPYRWAKPDASLGLAIARPADYRITLTLGDGAAPQPRPVTVYVNGQVVGTVVPERDLQDFALDYRLDPTTWVKREQALQIELHTEAVVPPGDSRALGHRLARVAVTVDPLSASRTDWGGLAAPALLFLVAAYGALRLGGVGPPWAGALLVGCGALIATQRDTALLLAYGAAVHPAGFVAALLVLAALPPLARATAAPVPTPAAAARAGSTGAAILILPLFAATPERTLDILDRVLRTGSFWGLAVLTAAGILTLAWLDRPGAPARGRVVELLAYALVGAALIAWWRWVIQPELLAALPATHALDREVVALLPAVLAIGAGAQLCVGLLLPDRAAWKRLATADLATGLVFLAVPVLAHWLAARPPSILEKTYQLAWLATPLVLVVAWRALLAVRTLLLAANKGRIGERRLALALLAAVLAVYWPAGLWRGTSAGLTGDEPQYLAGAMSLWRHGDLELASSIASPEMAAIVADRANDLRVDAYEDFGRDRLALGGPAAETGGKLILPLVGGDGLGATVGLLNPGLAPVAATVAFHNEAGREVATEATTVGPGQTATLTAPPAPAPGWLSATVQSDAPLAAAARLHDPRAGDELVRSYPAAPRQCLPVSLDGRGWETRLLARDASGAGAGENRGSWSHLDRTGRTIARGDFAIAAGGLAAISLAVGSELGAVCVEADRPVAAALLARGTGDATGLLVLGAAAPRMGSTAMPQPPRGPSLTVAGRSRALVHNPGTTPVFVTLRQSRATATADEGVTIPPGGTHEFEIAPPSDGLATYRAGTVEANYPAIVTLFSDIGAHTASVTPVGSAARRLLFPIVDGFTAEEREAGHLFQLDLTNEGRAETGVTATLRDTAGAIVRRDEFRICGSCAITRTFWTTGGTSLSVEGGEPLTGTVLHRVVRTRQPFHSVALSFALVPGYALAGYRGALATIGLIVALLAPAMYFLLRALGIGRSVAVTVAALLAFSPPLLPYAAQIYPETGGTLLLALALLALGGAAGEPPLAGQAGAARRYGSLFVALGCALGAPYFHSRLLPLSLVLLVAAIALFVGTPWRGRQASLPSARLLALGLPVALLAGALLLAGLWALEPRIRPESLRRYFSLATFGQHILGILFDRGTGLLPGLPVLLLAGSGFAWAIRRRVAVGLPALALAGTHLLVVASRASGWESWGPPGRYALPAVPFLGLALGSVWAWGLRPPVRPLAYGLATWGVLVGVFYSWAPRGAYYPLGSRLWFADEILRATLGFNPLRIFPSILSYAPASPAVTLGATATLVIGALLGIRWRLPRRRVVRPGKSRPLELPGD